MILITYGMEYLTMHALSLGYYLAKKRASRPMWSYTLDPPFIFPQSKVVKFLLESGIMALQWEVEVDNSKYL